MRRSGTLAEQVHVAPIRGTWPSMTSGSGEASRAMLRVVSRLRSYGLLRTGGNVSARLQHDSFLITPTGFSVDRLGSIRQKDLVTVAIGGPQPPLRASSETPLHTLLYARFDDIRGICHAHPPSVMALGEPSDWPLATAAAIKFMPVHLASGAGKDLARSIAPLLDAPDNQLKSAYGVTIVVPGHGIFSASWSIQRALYLLMRIDENATVALLRGSLDDGR
ncbi:MAG: class II aldolase/adducin family protein [Chloroflexota bacterium]|nr:class II aldolase/adducin family protein [Chloroflexota bacterium]